MPNLAISLGGTCTGEDVVCMGLLDLNPAQLCHALNFICNIIKALDQSNIMNPGKIIKRN